MEAIATITRSIGRFESVRCLECGEVYAKPLAGGTVEQNPGCPLCGYVGWIPLTRPPERGSLRSVEGQPPLRFVPAR
jgi:NAD-dependent SIR2 family protein deacetylase